MPNALLDVVGQRVHLQRQVAAVHGVEEVEPDRELGAEARECAFAPSSVAGLREHEVDRGQLDDRVADLRSSREFSSGTQSKHQA